MIVCCLIQAVQTEPMCFLLRRGTAECIERSPFRGWIPVLDTIPVDSVWALRDVIKVCIPNQRAKVLFVERDLALGLRMLLGRPVICIDHDRQPSHHAAAEHISK